jgi:predicted permease
MKQSHDESRSERVFRRLLVFFPREFRESFGEAMVELFRDQLREAHANGGAGVFWIRTLVQFMSAALLERYASAREMITFFLSRAMFDNLTSDMRFAGRMLFKNPLFTIVAAGCISLGSGAVATIYSTINALVLRPLPGAADATQLFRIERKEPGKLDGITASYPYYQYLAARTQSLAGIVAWSKASLSVRSATAEMGTAIYGNFVSGNFFSVLGVRPALGRFFLPDDDRVDITNPAIVVSEGFWRTRLGADSSVLGKNIWVNGHRFALIGVAPSDFQGTDAPIQTDAWLPLHARQIIVADVRPLTSVDALNWRLAGRLKPGVTARAAHEELSGLTAALSLEKVEPAWMKQYADARFSQLMGLPPDATSWLKQFLGILLVAATLVLLIASVNVASMLSARAVSRRREMAVRAALGAARGRLIRQLLTEIMLLFAMGAVGGIAIAFAATTALEHLPVQAELPFSLELSPDLHVFAFALGISLLTGIVVGLAPALRSSRSDIATRLRDGAAGATGRRALVTSSLVIGQLALSLLLLIGAGLFVRALQRGSTLDPGFDAEHVSTATLDGATWGYDEAKQRVFFAALRNRVASLPGVTSVSYTTILPLALRSSVDDIQFGAGDTKADAVQIHQLGVDADYFSVLRLPILEGRAIERRDDASAPMVAVVNETFAKRFWPRSSALGRTFRYAHREVTIVGVARDAKYESLAETTPALAYFSIVQEWRSDHALMVRTATDVRGLPMAIADAMRAIDPSLPRPTVMTLRAAASFGLMPQRVAAMITGILGGMGLLLAVAGLYGVIAYSASRRTKEIGIRLALGAQRTDVLRMIVREGVGLIAIGVAIGLALATMASRIIASFLFGVSPLDPVSFGATAASLAAIALFATWLPARRAAAANPMSVLRGE